MHNPICFGLSILLTTLAVAGCNQRDRSANTAQTEGPPLIEPAVPAGYAKVAPAPADTAKDMLSQTAVVFIGKLRDVQFSYDDCAGPRTRYVFSDSSSMLGAVVDPNVTLQMLGGPTPKGTWISVSELPDLALDAEYVVFLRNTDWTYSPVVGDLVFRREFVDGREVLIGPSGQAVVGWNEAGPVYSAATVSEPVGSQRSGYREATARRAPPHSASGDPDPGARVVQAQADLRAPPPRVAADTSASAFGPDAVELRASGRYARPAVSIAELANVETIGAERMTSIVREIAAQADVQLGGRLTLEPYWRCWTFTKTANAKR